MKHWLIGLLLLIGPSAFAQQAMPTIEFDSIPHPLRLPPNLYFGEVSGVSVNSKGHVFVLSRGNTTGRWRPGRKMTSSFLARLATG